MSDAALPPPSPEHRTPDLMDLDPFMQYLKDLHEETKSDDEEVPDGSKPSTSEKKYQQSDGIFFRPKRKSPPGKFLWIWMLGIRVPALMIDGEPNMPIEVFDEVLIRQKVEDVNFFQDLLRTKNVYIKMGSQEQFNAINEKSDVCRQLKITTVSMMSRSDIERIMGELRKDSRETKVEHHKWNDEERVHVVHVNFVDLCDTWLESDDLEEDFLEAGTHGYWYKSRRNMRCIKCRDCDGKFTPTDFVMHHHNTLKPPGVDMKHHGLTSNLWYKYIEVHRDSNTEENQTAWRRFVMNSHRIGKRSYAEAEPQERKEEVMEVEEEEEDPETDIGPPLVKKVSIDHEADISETKKNLHIADFLGPTGAKGLHLIKPRDELEEVILGALKKMDDTTLEMLFLKSPQEFIRWIKDMDFEQKVLAQQEQWNAARKDPNYRDTASAFFNPRNGTFENLRNIQKASKGVKEELKTFGEGLMKVERERESCGAWESIIKEQQLLRGLSDEATRALDNQPALPTFNMISQLSQFQLPQTLVAPNPMPFGSLSLSLVNSTGSGAFKPVTPTPKPVTPLVSPVIHAPIATKTPMTPITPVTTTPMSPNVELMKQHIMLALSNPNLFPVLNPKLPTAINYEQLSQLLKTTSVQN